MIKFIKDSLAELEHVVWPTPADGKKYMTYVIGTIIILGIFLAIIGMTISSILTFTRDQVQLYFPSTAIVDNTPATGLDVANILKDTIPKTTTGTTQTGAVQSASGITLTPTTVTTTSGTTLPVSSSGTRR